MTCTSQYPQNVILVPCDQRHKLSLSTAPQVADALRWYNPQPGLSQSRQRMCAETLIGQTRVGFPDACPVADAPNSKHAALRGGDCWAARHHACRDRQHVCSMRNTSESRQTKTEASPLRGDGARMIGGPTHGVRDRAELGQACLTGDKPAGPLSDRKPNGFFQCTVYHSGPGLEGSRDARAMAQGRLQGGTRYWRSKVPCRTQA